MSSRKDAPRKDTSLQYVICFVLVHDLMYCQTPNTHDLATQNYKPCHPPKSAPVSATGITLWPSLKWQSENCPPLYLVPWCLRGLSLYLVGRSLKGTKSRKRGKNSSRAQFCFLYPYEQKNLLAQSKKGAETEPCNTNKGLKRQT